VFALWLEFQGNGEKMDTREKITPMLESLLIQASEFRQLEAGLDVFCPFEALGMVGAEIRHSNYLAYILNPHRPHGFGAGLLRPFLIQALAVRPSFNSNSMTPLDVHLLDLGSAEIRREWQNIDLLIVVPQEKVVVAIELKIDAQQSGNQLQRYRRTVEQTWPENEWRRVFIFLTKHEEQPHANWIPIRLPSLVKTIDDFLSTSADGALSVQTLRAYSSMLKRHHMENKELTQLARVIWSRHSEALTFLMRHQPDVFGGLFTDLSNKADEIAEEASEITDLSIVRDDDQARIMRFAVEEWDHIPGLLGSDWTSSKRVLLFELKFESECVRGYLYIGPGADARRQEILDALAPIRKRKGYPRAWSKITQRDLLAASDLEFTGGETASELIKSRFVEFLCQTAKLVHDHLQPLMPQSEMPQSDLANPSSITDLDSQ
jgi:hypothetical protein